MIVKRGTFWRVIPLMLALALIAAGCSVGGDDDDTSDDPTNTPMAASATATPETDQEESESTEEGEAQADPSPTEEPEPSATPTETPDPTATPTTEPTATATPEPVVESPFSGVARPEAVLSNYTLTYSIDFEEGLPEAGSMEIFVEQHAEDNYHIRAGGEAAEGFEEVEIWVVGDQTYFRTPDGQVTQVPGQMDQTLFSPSAYLILTPDLANVSIATDLGIEEVDGRPARHYRVDPQQLDEAGLLEDVEDYRDPEGAYDVWVDEELGIVLRMTGDASWSDDAGTRYSVMLDYELSNINSTAEIQPPV